MPRLLVKKREEIIEEYVIKKNKIKIFIGSKRGNDIVIVGNGISEKHCTIVSRDNGYIIKDHNTIFGTKVNSKNIIESVLSFDDEICIGEYRLSFLEDISYKQDVLLIPQYYLIGIYGKFYGKKFFLKKEGDTFIGRETLSPRGIENDIILHGDMTVSKGHAKISSIHGQYSITDVGSTGGVAVNGEKLGQLNTLKISLGDEISIGRTIFRVVDYFTENYSLPLKQKLKMLVFFKYLSIFISLVVSLFSFYFLFSGFSTYLTLTSSLSKLNLSLNTNWSKEVPVKTDFSSYNITSTPLVADLDKDGFNDISMLSSNGFLYAWNGLDGNKIWPPIEISNSGVCSLVADDINNDGVADIIIAGNFSLIYIIDGQTGNIIRREFLSGTISKNTPVVCDLDGDGKKDIVVVSEEGNVFFMYSPGFDSSYTKISESVDGPVYASPVILLRKNFSPFVVVANYDSKVFFIDGKTRIKKTVNLLEKSGKVHLVSGAPAIGDINGDGIDEVVVQSNIPQYVSAIDTTNFSVMWTYFVEPIPPSNLKFNSSPVVSDFNGDGICDVAVLSGNGTVQILKGNTLYPSGEMLWKLSIPEAKRIISSPAVYDFDKDGINEIVFGTEDGKLVVAKSNPKRRELEVMTDIKASNLAITSTPILADIDGDGLIEILYTNIQDSIQIVKTNAKTIKNLQIWPMFLANAKHTSIFSDKKIKDISIKKMIIGFLILILFILFKVRSVASKAKKRVKVIYI